MIKAKHSFKKKIFEIKEEFIDRTEAKSLYRQKMLHNDKDYNVLVFYGIGGIGKTKLRKELCRIHKEENANAIIFYLDLNSPEDRNLGSGILKLVDSCNIKIDFRCFEMAYALYYRKKNPGALYGREQEMFTDNTLVGIGLNILGIFDGGITSTAAEIVERTIRTIQNRSIDSAVKEELECFDSYSIAEMEERLPLFFQYDLMTYLDKHEDTKVLIQFDTFEALNENVIEQIHRNRNERWIQEIIEYFDSETFPNLITVIFGRDMIVWDDDWNQMIDQYQLHGFDRAYSIDYLTTIGIDNDTIVQEIVKASRGYPFLLYLSAETYANIVNSGREPEIEDFGRSYPEIIERFIYNLDKNSVEVLRLMSVANIYNDELFNYLIKKFNISFPITEYEQFNKYSFVNYDDKEEDYYILDIIRQNIVGRSSYSIIQSIHRALLDYYVKIISKEPVSKNSIQLFYHSSKCMTVEEFNIWLNTEIDDEGITPIKILKYHQIRGEQSILIYIIDGILKDFKLDDISIELVNIYVDIVHLGGDYDVAVKICDRYLKQFTEDQIISDKQLLKMRIRKIHHSMFFSPVDVLINDASILIEKVDKTRYIEEYNELLFLLGGNLGVLSGNFDVSWNWLAKSMDFAEANGLKPFIHRTVRKQADILLYRNQYQEALSLINRTIDKKTTIDDIDSRYKIYLMAVLAEVYRKKGDAQTAWNCYEIVDKKSTDNYLPGWQAHAYLGKGMVQLLSGDYSEALKYYEKALSIYNKIDQKWGIINTDEAILLAKKKMGIELEQSEVINVKNIAAEMRYHYNEEFADMLLKDELPYLQLFFL